MQKTMEDAVEAAVNSFEAHTPNEKHFDHQGVIKMDVVVDLDKIAKSFEAELPFKVKSIADFKREVLDFVNYFMINELSFLGCTVPDVVELQITPSTGELNEIGYVSASIEDFESDVDLGIIQTRFISNFISELFESKSLFFLTQRMIEPSAIKVAA